MTKKKVPRRVAGYFDMVVTEWDGVESSSILNLIWSGERAVKTFLTPLPRQ